MGVTHNQAVCLRRREWSETSQTVILMTQGHGLVRGLAKGSRREKAIFSGGFELLQLGEVGMILKPDSDLTLLTEWDLTNPFSALRSHYDAGVLCMFAAEITASSLAAGDPHPEVFRALVDLLQHAADQPAGAPHALAAYLGELLHGTGHAPDLTAPGSEPATQIAYFDPVHGSIRPAGPSVRTTTNPFDPQSPHDARWPIRRATVAYLLALREGGANQPAPRETVLGGVRFLAAWASYRAGRRPASIDAFLRVTRS